MKILKENNFIRQFRVYNEYLNESKRDKQLKPFFCYSQEKNLFFATKYFSKETIINKFKVEIIC
jgi:hypothetical protein